MGPAWGRWIQACLPDDTASYARLRVLTTLECDGDRTMKQLAEALKVTPGGSPPSSTPSKNTARSSATPTPTGGRSTLVTITEAGLEAQRLGWQQYQSKVAVAVADLPADD